MERLMDLLLRRPAISLAGFSLALLLAGNWILPLTDRDEVRFAEASREMLQRGDYVVPWFNGNYRFDKPILIYWCQSFSYRLLGETDFAARVPSVLFTTGTALLLLGWGRRLAGARAGFFAGAMFLASLHLSLIGRVATADMALVFFYTLALWGGWEWSRPAQGHRAVWGWIFFTSLALTFLAKGPENYLALVGLALCRWWRRQDYVMSPWTTLAGVAWSLGLIAAWAIPALLESHGKYLNVGIGEHVIHRSVGVNDSHGLKGFLGFVATLPLYFITFFPSFLPWSLAVPIALAHWWPLRRGDVAGSYLLVQAGVVFAVFSLVRTKLPHYTMPAFPCLALWLALQVQNKPSSTRWLGWGMVSIASFIAVLMFLVMPFARKDFLTENLWQATRDHVLPQTRIGCFGYTESSLVWRFRTFSTNDVTLGPVQDAPSFTTNPPPFILVLPTEDLPQVTNLPALKNALRVDVHGLDIVKFKERNLSALLVE